MAFRRLRFHLSTALLLTIVAGALIGLNLRQRFNSTGGPEKDGWYYGELRFGFPFDAFVGKGQVWTDPMLTDAFAARFVKVYNRDDQWNVYYIKGHGILFRPKENRGVWSLKAGVWNGVSALGILVAVCVVSEVIIRRKKISVPTN